MTSATNPTPAQLKTASRLNAAITHVDRDGVAHAEHGRVVVYYINPDGSLNDGSIGAVTR